jgi:hypothetical protein
MLASDLWLRQMTFRIRKSSFLMKESVSLKRFAPITRDLMEAVRDTAGKIGGWFDKFPGDGFIIY